MDFFKEYFGQKLKTLLKDRNMTQSQLAELIGVEQSSVSKWCTGKDEPSSENLATLFEKLKVDQSYFLGGEQSRSPLDQALTITQAQLKALADEAAKSGAEAVMGAINKPTVAVYDDSPKGMVHKLIEGLNDDEAKKIHSMINTWIDVIRKPAPGRYIRPQNLRKDKK